MAPQVALAIVESLPASTSGVAVLGAACAPLLGPLADRSRDSAERSGAPLARSLLLLDAELEALTAPSEKAPPDTGVAIALALLSGTPLERHASLVERADVRRQARHELSVQRFARGKARARLEQSRAVHASQPLKAVAELIRAQSLPDADPATTADTPGEPEQPPLVPGSEAQPPSST